MHGGPQVQMLTRNISPVELVPLYRREKCTNKKVWAHFFLCECSLSRLMLSSITTEQQLHVTNATVLETAQVGST